MSTFEKISAYGLDDTTPIQFSYDASTEVSLRNDFSEIGVLIEDTPIFNIFWSLIQCPSMEDSLKDYVEQAFMWADRYGVDYYGWTEPEDLDEEEQNHHESYDDAVEEARQLYLKYPADLADFIDVETVRHDYKSGKVVGSWNLSTTWGDVKEDSELWRLVDTHSIVVTASSGEASIVFDQ